MDYTELNLKITPREPFADILTYRLSEIGFDMFEDTSDGIKAYIIKQQFSKQQLDEVISDVKESGCTIEYQEIAVPWKNWNEEWESNFQPEIIAEQIYVRAEFHPANSNYKHELVVQPRMAFGTGHHPTTAQVMEMMLSMDFNKKKILDMGCGTGILAILALQLGADYALAIDNDDNAVENTSENAIRNGFPEMDVRVGDVNTVKEEIFDSILANINRNIILQDLETYHHMLKPKGELVCSGFYIQDLNIIRTKAESLHFNFIRHTVKNDWCCARFEKQ